LCGFCKCSHIHEYAALSKTPHALADGLMLVFQHPDSASGAGKPFLFFPAVSDKHSAPPVLNA
jgi:hypothetical protein